MESVLVYGVAIWMQYEKNRVGRIKRKYIKGILG